MPRWLDALVLRENKQHTHNYVNQYSLWGLSSNKVLVLVLSDIVPVSTDYV
jgi:hypothetical protein